MKSERLKELAEQVVAASPAWSQIEDDVALCDFVSKRLGVELTLADAEKLREFLPGDD